ncbi:TAXI family TRAP transporter solute-binding subunit [Sphaerotilus uruguayifluvii]|uniref:TRAP transporter TAXI family solute receptor n=1 Tax=Sphaerotilus uruguayifluvii TaxID=2735897 RepID=A0ABX2G5E3_9BURK|nr:TAXI family TRAP transporter solute-binding subunit [Leptothrix sp. C29]NRT57553.1 TRAP transporter TAXI family solute receptor [Leptothrix sp. C29]
MSALPRPSPSRRLGRAAALQLRATLLSLRDLLLTGGPVLLLAVGLVWMAYVVLDPNPPRHMVLATGGAQGAYAEFGKRYQQALARHGIEVELRATRGSLDNLKLLQDGEVDAAFVQGGADEVRGGDEPPPEDLLSLGGLFREPVWVFYREQAAVERAGRERLESLSQLDGWRLNVGQDGSGVTNLMRRLLEANGLDMAAMPLSRLATTPAVVELLEGRIDALALVSAPESPIVRMLLITPGIRLLDFTQAEAYARRVPQVSPVLLPRGVVDLARDLPAQDVHLVSATAALLVRENTHPALQQLLVQAARRIHGEPNWFQHKGEYPKAQAGDYALSPEAQRFYAAGEPLLQRHLPFWLSNLIDRMWVVLVSIIAVLIPLSRVVPPLYNFRVRSRIFRWYGLLRDIEQQQAEAARAPADLLAELDQLDERVGRLPVPLSYAEELYALRSHIALVRQRLHERPPAPNDPETEPRSTP